jgi:hypothetical protein
MGTPPSGFKFQQRGPVHHNCTPSTLACPVAAFCCGKDIGPPPGTWLPSCALARKSTLQGVGPDSFTSNPPKDVMPVRMI